MYSLVIIVDGGLTKQDVGRFVRTWVRKSLVSFMFFAYYRFRWIIRLIKLLDIRLFRMLLFDCFAWVHNKLVSELLVKAWEELCSCFWLWKNCAHKVFG